MTAGLVSPVAHLSTCSKYLLASCIYPPYAGYMLLMLTHDDVHAQTSVNYLTPHEISLAFQNMAYIE